MFVCSFIRVLSVLVLVFACVTVRSCVRVKDLRPCTFFTFAQCILCLCRLFVFFIQCGDRSLINIQECFVLNEARKQKDSEKKQKGKKKKKKPFSVKFTT